MKPESADLQIPDNRRTYPWGNEDMQMIAFHKEMIRIHKEYPVLRTGSLRMLSWANHVLTYGRFSEEEQIVVALNNSKELKEITILVWKRRCRDRTNVQADVFL